MNDHTDASDDRAREELLELYALGRLPPADRVAFEARLDADPALREALRREHDIVEGVRHAGREDLKRKLGSAAGAATNQVARPGLPWGRIAALAAMIMVVTGIALWQRWFFPAPSVEHVAVEPTAAEPLGTGQSSGKTAAAPQASLEARPAPPPDAEAKQSTPRSADGALIGMAFESGGVVLRDGAFDRKRLNRAKGDAAARPDEKFAKKEGMDEAEYSGIDTHTYRVEVSPGRRSAEMAESDASISDTVTVTVRVRGDSVTIALPAAVLGSAKDAARDARVTRINPDSVIIDAAGVRIRAFVPLRSLR